MPRGRGAPDAGADAPPARPAAPRRRPLAIGHERTCECPQAHINCMSAKEWLKAQLGVWRFAYERRDVRDKKVHPATFPISLARQVIELFTHQGELVLDPFVGSGTTLVAARDAGRNAVGLDLRQRYVNLANARVREGGAAPGGCRQVAVRGDARHAARRLEDGSVSLIWTSPPYANLLNRERRNKSRRERDNGQLGRVEQYSQDEKDLGTLPIGAYREAMGDIFEGLLPALKPRGHCVVNVPDMWWDNRRVTIHMEVVSELRARGYELRNIVIWDRTNVVNRVGIFGWPSNYITMGSRSSTCSTSGSRDPRAPGGGTPAAPGRGVSAGRHAAGQQRAGGILLFAAALLALAFANTDGLAEWRGRWLAADIGVVAGGGRLAMPVGRWINDGLMALFFLAVGLGIKRELAHGELSAPSRAALPLVAAVGGMAVPAAIFAAVNWGDDTAMRGWAIPVATDIAFTLGALALLGPRVPAGLVVLLAAIAVTDDVLAIAIIALFHTAGLDAASLVRSGALLGALFLMNRLRVTNGPAYLLVGAALWAAVLESGVHPTLAGVAVAMAIPARPSAGGRASLLARLERQLLPPVSFVILPVFAFANAGVDLRGLAPAALAEPIPLGIALGLVLGKTAGVLGASLALVRARVATLPDGCTWGMVLAMSMLCGIGFTVSLFIGNLAFGAGGEAAAQARLGVLTGAVVAGVAGCAAMLLATRPAGGTDGRAGRA